jgi:hypothetical protein
VAAFSETSQGIDPEQIGAPLAHLTARTAYTNLVERLNRFPQGAPPSEILFKILKLLFREDEANLVALLPIKPFNADEAARRWKKTETDATKILDALASRGLLLDIERDGTSMYTLPPPMAGFFEFSLMRITDDFDQKLLAELFYQYLNVEEEFIKALFVTGEPQLGRVFVNEGALPEPLSLSVLDYERASEIIATASHRAVGVCYCRHKMKHLRRACNAPLNICMTFNLTAASLIKHGIARPVDRTEILDLLSQARDRNLVQSGENVRQEVSFICNCCGCCCEAMLAAKRFGFFHPVHTTNYIPEIDDPTCNGCGKGVDVCAVQAMASVQVKSRYLEHVISRSNG